MFLILLHSKLGLETIVKDYISSSSLQKISTTIVNYVTMFLIFLTLISIIKINLM